MHTKNNVFHFYNRSTENIIFLLKNLGAYDFTKVNEPVKETDASNDMNIFELTVSGGKGVKSKVARLLIEDGNYILLEGSFIRKDSVNS